MQWNDLGIMEVMRYERHHPHLQKHTDSPYPPLADGDGGKKRENDRKIGS